MTDHRRLDEFGPGTADEEEPEPPEPTYRWDPDGATCGGCGDTVAAQWVGEYGLLCAACKEW